MDRSQVKSPKRVVFLNLAGAVVLPLAAYWWLTIPERRTWQIVLSAVAGLVIMGVAAWLCAATFRAMAGYDMGGGAVRSIPAVLICVLAVLLVLLGLAWVESHFQGWANWTASALTYRTRKPVKPETARRVLEALGWVVAWILIPVLAAPRLAAATTGGLRAMITARPRRRFFFDYLVAFAAGAWIPSFLIHWVPGVESFVTQAVSFAARFGFALVLAVTAWLWLAWSATRAIERRP